MAQDIRQKFGTATTMTCTLTSLGSSGTVGRESTIVDNSTDLFEDAILMIQTKVQNTAPGNDKAIYVFAYASVDGGTVNTGKATGVDASYTRDDPTTLHLVGVIPVPTQNIAYNATFSIAAAFGGRLPQKWGVVIINFTGITLSATAGDHVLKYQGVYHTVG